MRNFYTGTPYRYKMKKSDIDFLLSRKLHVKRTHINFLPHEVS